MSDRCPTVKIEHKGKHKFIIINVSDFDKKIHTKFIEPKKAKKGKDKKEE